MTPANRLAPILITATSALVTLAVCVIVTGWSLTWYDLAPLALVAIGIACGWGARGIWDTATPDG